MGFNKERMAPDVGPEVIDRVATVRIYDDLEVVRGRSVGRIKVVTVSTIGTGRTVAVSFTDGDGSLTCSEPGWYVTIEVAS